MNNNLKLCLVLNILKFQTDLPNICHHENDEYIHIHRKKGRKYPKC